MSREKVEIIRRFAACMNRRDVSQLLELCDRNVVCHPRAGTGAASGAEVSDAYVFVYKLRDGLVVEGREYRTRNQALQAVELTEQDARAGS